MASGADPFESGLTIALPWLVVVIVALCQAALQAPRPALPEPDRLLIVGCPLVPECPVTADHSSEVTGQLTAPAVLDLAASDADWLRLYGGGRVPRRAIALTPDELQGRVGSRAIESGARELEVEVTLPRPEAGAPRLVRVDTQPFRVFPPAPWDSYFYRLEGERPVPVLTLRDRAAPPQAGPGAEGRYTVADEALRRRNQHYVWTGEAFALEAVRGRLGQGVWLFRGAFAALAWWGWLLVALPVGALLLGAGRAVAAIGQASRHGRTANAEMAGLVLGLGLLGLAIAGVVALRRWPELDRVTALLAPVALVMALNLGLVTTAKCAQAEAARAGRG